MTDKEKQEFVNALDENWLGWWIIQQIKKKKLNKQDAGIYEDAGTLAMIFYWNIIEDNPKCYPNLQKEEGKPDRVTLWKKWTTQFNLLLHEYQTSFDEVERVTRYVIRSKYWSKAKYSAFNIRRNYLAIRNMMFSRRS